SDTSANPRSRCAPHDPARAAARTRAAALTFSTAASSSTRTAQSSPNQSSGWNEASAARSARTKERRDSATHYTSSISSARPSTLSFEGEEGRYARHLEAEPIIPRTRVRVNQENPYCTTIFSPVTTRKAGVKTAGGAQRRRPAKRSLDAGGRNAPDAADNRTRAGGAGPYERT